LRLLLFIIPIVLFACTERQGSLARKMNTVPLTASDTVNAVPRDSSEYEKLFVRSGLVNISEFDKDIRVVLLYNTDKNFLGKSVYKGLDQCYLLCDAATKLNHAQKLLKQDHPFYNLIVFDAARPSHVQKMMWDSLKMKPADKYNYVAKPDELSLHNFGAAVDVGIINENGILLDMGTPFDFFGELAQPKLENEMYASGKLSKEAYKNRLILRDVMKRAGFSPITSEWWHFNACTKLCAAENFTLIP
jgi:zinc D-Ala-D-Ala dipeptidase